jgi:YD repeat-containing protein
MVTRRMILKGIASALLIPAIPRLAFSSTTSSKVKKRIMAGTCAPCGNKKRAREVYSDFLQSAGILPHVSLPLALVPCMRTKRSGMRFGYVDSATGNLGFSIDDLSLAGLPDLQAVRRYNSQSLLDRGLGPGWSLIYDDFIETVADGSYLNTGNGERISLVPGADHTTMVALSPAGKPIRTLRTIDANTIAENVGGSTRTYKLISGAYHLTSVDLGHGRGLAISKTSDGRLESVAASWGGVLQYQWSADGAFRLKTISDNTGREVTFSYRNHAVVSAVDVEGATWLYDYDPQGLLAEAVDPKGSIVLAATYLNHRATVVQAITGTLNYQYSRIGDTTTSTIDSGNNVSAIVTHNALGQVTGASLSDGSLSLEAGYDASHNPAYIRDGKGRVTQYQYDDDGRLKLFVDGKKWQKRDWDINGNLVSLTDPIGTIVYTHGANYRQATGSRASRSQMAVFDQGRLVSSKTEKRTLTVEYTKEGKVSARTSTKTGRYAYKRSAQGWLIEEVFPSGKKSSCVRNARGQVMRWSNSRGAQINYQRDARGAITQIANASGDWAQAYRDDSGRIVKMTNSHGQERLFTYHADGRLSTFTDAKGRHFRVEYDPGNNQATRMVQSDGQAQIIRGKTGKSVFVSGDAQDKAVATHSTHPDNWKDPLHAVGLIGAFSGHTKMYVEETQADVATLSLVSFAAAATGTTDDGDDDGDDDDDDDDGDDDDDDDDDGDLFLPDPDDQCEDCEADAYGDCEDDYNASVSAIAASDGVAVMQECGLASINGMVGIANGGEGPSLYDVLECTFAGNAAQSDMRVADGTLADCIADIDPGCPTC